MDYVKKGKGQKKPGSMVKPKATVNEDRKSNREAAASHRRQLRVLTAALGTDTPREKDHLPGDPDDRFGQVYRKGGARDGIDMPDMSRLGRGYASPENN